VAQVAELGAENDKIAVQNKMKATKPPENAFVPIDWDKIFEHPEIGLITVINKAKSTQSLHRCTQVIVETLFNRDGDIVRRQAFATVVNDIVDHTSKVSKSEAVALAAAKTKINQVLRSIKQDRQNRAVQAQQATLRDETQKSVRTKDLAIVENKTKQNIVENQDDESSWTLKAETSESPSEIEAQNSQDFFETPQTDDVADEDKTIGGYKIGTPEAYFIHAISQAILERLTALRGKSIDRLAFPKGIPFILSAKFADYFEGIISEKVLPQLVGGCYVMINRMSVLPKDKWQEYLETLMADRTDRVVLWERWQIAWLQTTTQHEYPPKPKRKKEIKKSALRKFFDKLAEDDHYDDEDDGGEMTLEEWKEAAIAIKEENLEAESTWKEICKPSQDYIAPLDEDNRLLMEIFGHDPGVYKSDIKKLLQITKDAVVLLRVF